MPPLKIAFLMTQSLDSPLGIGRIGPLARALVKRGHAVSILALHPDYTSLSETQMESGGVQVYYAAPMHVKKSGNVKSYYSSAQLAGVVLRATRELTRLALRVPADVLHVCKPHPMNGLAGLAAARLRHKLLFVDCDDYEAATGHFKSGWQRLGVALFERRLPRLAAAVTVNTHFLQGLLSSWGVPPEKLCYLPNGVERDRFRLPQSEVIARLRAELGLEGRPVVAFIGSLSLASHPVNLLLEAFPQVQQAHPQAVLLIVGGGEDYERLRLQASDLGIGAATVFTGRVAPDKAPLYYHLSTVSVDPALADDSARGRLPMKLFESWAAGTPFVTADIGDRRMLLGEPPAGLLATPGSPASLAAAICELLARPGLAAELAQRGRERVLDYDWDRLAVRLEAEYLRRLPIQTGAERSVRP